jgi:choice-of-anchor C domain-containing protein
VKLYLPLTFVFFIDDSRADELGCHEYSRLLDREYRSSKPKSFKTVKSIFCLLTLLVGSAGLCSGQTVRNGSFEAGNAPPFGGSYIPAPNSTAISGWVVQAGSVDYIGNDTWPAADGSRSLDLSGHDAGTITQNISGFTPGHEYRLSFYMAANNDGVARIFRLQARIGSVTETFSFDATGRTYADMGWSLRTLDFIATHTTLTLEFTSLETGNAGPVLDNVSIAAPCVAAPSGLVSWWRAENNALDQVGGHNGMSIGNVSFVRGKVGQAFVFDGVSSGVRLGNPASLRLQNFTIEAWVKRASVERTTIPGIYDNAAFLHYGELGYGFGPTHDGRLLLTKVGIGGVYSSAVRVVDTNYHHVAVTKTGSTVIFYVDGVGETAAPYDPGFIFDTPVAIGARGTDMAASFLGSIDELSVYNRALSGAEIQAVYSAGSAGKCLSTPPPVCVPPPNNLASWWRAEGNALNSADSNSGTIVGRVTYAPGKVGQAFSLDGVNGSGVGLGNPASLQLQTFTIEAWVKRADLSRTTVGQIYDNAAFLCYGNLGYGFGPTHDGRLLLTKVGVGGVYSSTVRIADANYHHVAVTKTGSTVTFYVDGIGETAPPYDPGFVFNTPVAIGARGGDFAHPFWGRIDDLAVYRRALAPADIQAIHAAGSAGKCTPLPPANHPPVSDAAATKRLLVVPPGCSPTVVLDGSRSSDPDDDVLQYRWFVAGQSNAIATGVVAVATLPLGENSLMLVVDDGLATSTYAITVTVLTASKVVQGLMPLVNQAKIRHPKPVSALLSAAADSIRRHHPRVAIIQLRAFQQLVRVEVIRRDPVLAAKLVQALQQLIEALSQDCASAGSHWKLGKMLRQSNGQMRMKFSAPEGQRCLIEASTNLVDWETIGAASEGGPGEFEFADPDAAKLPARFYRVVDEER